MKSEYTKEFQIKEVVISAIKHVREISKKPLRKPLKGRGNERAVVKMDLRDRFQKKLFNSVPFSRRTTILGYARGGHFQSHVAYDLETAETLKNVLLEIDKIKNS